MKSNTLLILFLVFVAAAGASLWLTRDTDIGIESAPLLGDFTNQLTELQRISLRTQDTVLLTAERVDDEWYATHLSTTSQFPVDFEALSEFISSLQSAELAEAKTMNTENYSRLGVEDFAEENAQSRLLNLTTANASFELLVGNPSSNGLGSFVRKPTEAQSWLLDRVLNLPLEPESWLKNPILALTSSEIQRAEFVGESGWVVTRSEGGEFELKGIDETESLKYPNIISNTLSSILAVKFDSVLTTDSASLPETVDAQLLFETDNGPLTIKVYSENEMFWVTYDYPYQAWLGEWVFTLNSFGHGQLVKSRSDLLVVQAEEQEPEMSETVNP